MSLAGERSAMNIAIGVCLGLCTLFFIIQNVIDWRVRQGRITNAGQYGQAVIVGVLFGMLGFILLVIQWILTLFLA